MSTEKTKLGVAIRTSERNLKKCAEKITTLEQEVVEAGNDLRKLQERRKQIEEEAMTHKTSQEALEVTEKEMRQKLADFKKELDAALKFVSGFQLPASGFQFSLFHRSVSEFFSFLF